MANANKREQVRRAVADYLADAVGRSAEEYPITKVKLAQEGAIETAGGRAQASKVPLPPTLRLTILRRISFLPEDTLLALRAASVLGSGFSLTDLATVTGRSSLDLSVALEKAIKASVLEDDGVRLRFRHDLVVAHRVRALAADESIRTSRPCWRA